MAQINQRQTIEKNYLKTLKNLAASKESFQAFKKLGLPPSKHEDWYYTPLTKFLVPEIQQVEDLTEYHPLKFEQQYGFEPQIVVQNGSIVDVHLPAGVGLKTESFEAAPDADAFELLSQGLEPRCLSLTIKTNQKKPITIVHLLDPKAEKKTMAGHIKCSLSKHVEASLCEIFIPPKKSFTQGQYFTSTQLEVADNAHLGYLKVHLGSTSFHHHTIRTNCKRDSQFKSLCLNLAPQLLRHNQHVFLNEPGAHAEVHGLYPLKENEVADHFIQLHHRAPHTTSNQLFKGMLNGNSRGIFTGKVLIHKGAFGSDAGQLNKNLLLSEKAHADTRPQLEVYNDDVKAAHGSTVGQMNEEERFYLESRGIPTQEATEMLLHGYAMDVLEKNPVPAWDQRLESWLLAMFEKKQEI